MTLRGETRTHSIGFLRARAAPLADGDRGRARCREAWLAAAAMASSGGAAELPRWPRWLTAALACCGSRGDRRDDGARHAGGRLEHDDWHWRAVGFRGDRRGDGARRAGGRLDHDDGRWRARVRVGGRRDELRGRGAGCRARGAMRGHCGPASDRRGRDDRRQRAPSMRRRRPGPRATGSSQGPSFSRSLALEFVPLALSLEAARGPSETISNPAGRVSEGTRVSDPRILQDRARRTLRNKAEPAAYDPTCDNSGASRAPSGDQRQIGPRRREKMNRWRHSSR